MAQQHVVPTALRNELTEYSSLLRALRTSQTLDVTAHLTQHNTPSSNYDDSEPGTSSGSLKPRRSKSSDVPHWTKRDQWTRWPLLVNDVPPPEWDLQDELGIIVNQILGLTDSDFSMDDDNDESSDSEDEEKYTRNLAKLLTPVVENYLESLFALISAHTIARSDSMQNRIEPFDWRDLVNILGSPTASHLVDETMLQNLISKMQTISETTPASTSTSIPPPTPESALHNHRLAKTSRSRLNHLLSNETEALFHQTLPPPGYRYLTLNQTNIKKAKAKWRARTRSTAKAETDDDMSSSEPENQDVQTEEHSQHESDGSEWTESGDEG